MAVNREKLDCGNTVLSRELRAAAERNEMVAWQLNTIRPYLDLPKEYHVWSNAATLLNRDAAAWSVLGAHRQVLMELSRALDESGSEMIWGPFSNKAA